MFGDRGVDIQAMGDTALVDEFERVEREYRAVLARRAALVSAIERRGIPKVGGHGSTAAWVRATANCSAGDATAAVRLGRVTHEFPQMAEALSSGHIGASQAALMAASRAKPRSREHFCTVVDALVDLAAELPFPDFKLRVRRFEMVVDPDGAARDDDSRHENRTATVAIVGDGLFVHAQSSTIHGVEMVEIFEHFVQAEFDADWAACVKEHGELASVALLARTNCQRRADALAAVFRAAATAPVDRGAPVPVVNLIIDQTTFEPRLTELATGRSTRRDAAEVLASGRCETIDGQPVHPDDVIAAAMIGVVRRVVYDSGGTVINFGRKQRLFAGATREAAQLQVARCGHAGCLRPVQQCEIDHVVPWSHGGPTDLDNARPTCAKHNRWRNLGLQPRRDRHGIWRTYHPDGTIAA